MDERQQILMLINGSANVMKDIAAVENELSILENKQEKFRRDRKKATVGVVLFDLFSLSVMFKNGFALFAVLLILLACVNIPFVLMWRNAAARKGKISKLTAQLAGYRSDPSLSWLPPAYRDSFSWEKIGEYIVNLRANTLQEAINLLETEQHQARLEFMAALGNLT